MRTCKAAKQQGQVLFIVALSMVVLLGTLGLAIDSGMGYISKAKLNAAVDSAVIAAARAVTQGATQAEQTANAQQAARNFFSANYPNNFLGSNPVFPDPTVTFNGGQVTIDASATATVPVSLMGVMNFKFLNVAASAQSVRKDLDLAFVVDTTGSMAVDPTVPPKVRTNAKLFLTKFNQTLDRIALIQFAYGAVVRDPFKPVLRGFDINSMNTHIDAFNFAGSTNSAEGVWQARDQLNNVIAPTKRSSLRVIVFFSDGAPNSFASYFTFKTPADCISAGTLSTGDQTTPNWPAGLRHDDQINSQLPLKCWQNASIVNTTNTSYITKLPDWYNAHNPLNLPALQEFPVVTATPRVVTNDTSTQTNAWRNVNRASRNLLEAMAAKSRNEGVYVFTLGLGQELTIPEGADGEIGENVLKCMANTADALPRCVTAGAGQPVGLYCHAVDANGLKPCFDKLASAILRITK
ncbi:VWA domain-containing protein [Paraherbaspirillum soli]|uniref:VWA domain-containing protein n=1 Tax=Paraherbaspirillum soli TaxID=631222 RepID=A0ABW0ME57_9BURK